MPQKKPQKNKKEDPTPSETFDKYLDEYFETAEAINIDYKDAVSALLDDYVMPQSLVDKLASLRDGLETELATADKNFTNNVTDLFEDIGDYYINEYKKKLRDDELDDDEVDDLFNKFPMEWVIDKIKSSENVILLKPDTLDNMNKIEEFLKTEVWPLLNDQRKFLEDF